MGLFKVKKSRKALFASVRVENMDKIFYHGTSFCNKVIYVLMKKHL